YHYNNFLHHRVDEIIVCCLKSKNASLVKHILEDCNLVSSIIDAERNSALSTDENNAKPTVPTEGRMPPRTGNVGHMTRIANKLVQLMADNDYIYAYLQDNSKWVKWHTNVLLIRNTHRNVSDWECGGYSSTTIGVYASGSLDRDDEDVRGDPEQRHKTFLRSFIDRAFLLKRGNVATVKQEVAATVESMEKAVRYTSNKYVEAALNLVTVVLPYLVPFAKYQLLIYTLILFEYISVVKEVCAIAVPSIVIFKDDELR
nr:hypothetical protein [Tanacetum cinerariifolium]GEY94550.1 hypothetical protein [Tanacetum cinerariifolium]